MILDHQSGRLYFDLDDTNRPKKWQEFETGGKLLTEVGLINQNDTLSTVQCEECISVNTRPHALTQYSKSSAGGASKSSAYLLHVSGTAFSASFPNHLACQFSFSSISLISTDKKEISEPTHITAASATFINETHLQCPYPEVPSVLYQEVLSYCAHGSPSFQKIQISVETEVTVDGVDFTKDRQSFEYDIRCNDDGSNDRVSDPPSSDTLETDARITPSPTLPLKTQHRLEHHKQALCTLSLKTRQAMHGQTCRAEILLAIHAPKGQSRHMNPTILSLNKLQRSSIDQIGAQRLHSIK